MEIIYNERFNCIFCECNNLTTLLDKNLDIPLSVGLYSEIKKSHNMPYNLTICNNCDSVQNKYIGDLKIVYDSNHVDDFGSVKSKKHNLFSNFILENKNIKNIIEVGSSNGALCDIILEKNDKINYSIIEPSYIGKNKSIHIIKDYLENIDLNTMNNDAIIMSDVFEHFYEPIKILEKIKNSNIQYIYLNHPDFDNSIDNNTMMNLNAEHTFLIEHQFLFSFFHKYGFKLNKRFDFENHSIFLEFEREETENIKVMKNNHLRLNIQKYIDKMFIATNKMNDFISNNSNYNYYIWPSSVHSTIYFTFGLDYTKFTGILDNSPNKIGKYIYGYNLLCSSFDDMIKNNEENVCIFIGGAGNYIKELNLTKTNKKIIFIHD
jgi:hypothetical protein